jgi:hypothetical protein
MRAIGLEKFGGLDSLVIKESDLPRKGLPSTAVIELSFGKTS